MEELKETSLKSKFQKLAMRKQSLMNIAETCSALTLQYIFPPNNNDNQPLYQSWQSVGARGVNNLSSKLLLALLPTTGGFFTYKLDEALRASLPRDVVNSAEDYLTLLEKMTMQELNQLSVRYTLSEALKHLIITGNVALWFKDDKLKLYNLRDYVVVRDKAMNLTEVILRETVDKDTLPKALRDFIAQQNIASAADIQSAASGLSSDMYDIFTAAKLTDGKWEMWQEIGELEVPNTRKWVKLLPILVLRWTNNEYGHGLVEQVLGDLLNLESLSKAVTNSALAAAKTIFLVRPSAETNINLIKNAKNGDIIIGNKDDVGTMGVSSYADLKTAQEQIMQLENRINQMFLVFNPRSAERVTAEEIRRLTEELEALLGGVYTLLAEELQKPLLQLIREKIQKTLPQPPDEDVKLVLTSGFEALARTTELNKLLTFLSAVGNIQPALQYINWYEYLTQIVSSLSLNAQGLIKTQEELMAEQQQMLQMQAAQNIIGGGV